MTDLRIAVLCACVLVASAGLSTQAGMHTPASRARKSLTPHAAPQASGSAARKKKTSGKKKRASRREPSQKAPTPDRISEIQTALARGGYYQGDPNGKWDANTIGAVEKFQSAHGIDASGKLDAPTLQKLGLGSDIAGVSAPKPVKPASSAPASQPSSPVPSSTVPSGS